MRQLAGSDAVFLAFETPDNPAHTAGLTVLDPTDAPGFGFERFRDVVAERIRLAPRFSWKLREVPFGLDRPYWVGDPGFDVDRHLHRIAVPAPGGMRELADLAAHLYTRTLHRDRPLWEIWFIEGVEHGRYAMFAKIHHALMDGVSGAGLGELLCDLEPDPAPRLPAAETPAPEAPGLLSLARRGLLHLAERPFELGRLATRAAQELALQIGSSSEPGSPPLLNVPRTIFNHAVGPRRGFSCSSLPIEGVKAVKKRFDVTVNDVILAVVGSALRQWLLDHDALPDESLVALVPVSTRADGDLALGNQVTNVSVLWATDEPDPVERLMKVHRNALNAKRRVARSTFNPLQAVGDTFTPAAAGLMLRAWLAVADVAPLLGNAILSTVRGTPVPLYTAGARIECMYPMSILLPGQGVNVTALSYMDRVDIGFTVDPDLIPDAWSMAAAVPRALDQLWEAAGRRAEAVGA